MCNCLSRVFYVVIVFVISYFFFFSSRRRHTRYWRDWSSDVCSSDLVLRWGRDADTPERLVRADAAAADRGRPHHRRGGAARGLGERRLRGGQRLPQGCRRHRDRPAEVGRLHAAGDGAHPRGGAVRRVRLGHPRVPRPPADPRHRARPLAHRARPLRLLRRAAGHLQPPVRAERRVTAAPEGDGRPGPARPADGAGTGPQGLAFDRHLVLDQLGGWRGMLDATLPTVAFIVANSLAGLRAGIWSALAVAVLLFALRLVRRESVQQAFSGLFRSEEHTPELQSRQYLVCRLLLEKKKTQHTQLRRILETSSSAAQCEGDSTSGSLNYTYSKISSGFFCLKKINIYI